MKEIEKIRECRAVVADIGEGMVQLEMEGAVEIFRQEQLPNVHLGQVLSVRFVGSQVLSYAIDYEATKSRHIRSKEATNRLLEQ